MTAVKMAFSRFLRLIRRLSFPRSLRYQLLSRSLLILLGLLLLIGAFQYVIMQSFLYRNQAETIQNQIRTLRLDMVPQIGRPNNSPRERFIFPDWSLAIITADEEFNVIAEDTKAGSIPKLSSEEYAEALKQNVKKPNYRTVKNEEGTNLLVVLDPIGPRGHVTGVVQVSTPTAPLKDLLLQQMLIFVSLSLLALIGGLLLFLPILKKTLVPLSSTVDKVGSIDAGKLDERLPVYQGQTEIDRLSVSFNGMLERLQSSFEAEKEAMEHMRRFIADASHELRTPLTSIHGFLEVLLRGAASQPEQLEKALKSMYGESERINKLVQDLLLLAKLDRSPTFHMKVESLDSVIVDMEPQLRLLAGDRKVRFKIAPDVFIPFNQDKIKQVILNLFHNAVQHTDPLSGVVEVSLDRSGNGAVISVKDNGSGIPEEHLSHLFERFYRVDTSRARKHGGSGLGLAITKSIVDLHHGAIKVESSAGSGSVFRIWLPNGAAGK